MKNRKFFEFAGFVIRSASPTTPRVVRTTAVTTATRTTASLHTTTTTVR